MNINPDILTKSARKHYDQRDTREKSEIYNRIMDKVAFATKRINYLLGAAKRTEGKIK